MLNAIIRFSLGHRSLIVAICLVLTVYGGYLSTTFADRCVSGPRPAARRDPDRVSRVCRRKKSRRW